MKDTHDQTAASITADPEEHTYDVVVVGTGAAGMTAAVTAALRGLSVVVLEKTNLYGGTTAYSGAAAWIPQNHVIERLSMGWVLPKVGLADTTEKAKTYLMGLVGPSVKPERIDAYLREGPRMLVELEEKIGMRWLHWPMPDYFAERLGGVTYGRTIEPTIFNGGKLGAELKNQRPSSVTLRLPGNVAATGNEAISLGFGFADLRGPLAAVRVVSRAIWAKLTGGKPLGLGQSFLAQMRLSLIKLNVPLWLSMPVTGLITQGSGNSLRVVGVNAVRDNRAIIIRATRGVVLATGGFSQSPAMREKYLPQPTKANWSFAPEGQDGDGLNMAETVGAALDITDKAWGFPAVLLPDANGKVSPIMALWERMKPGAIVVNGAGKRYFDEGMSYEETWKTMYAKDAPGASTIPSWMIFDARAKRKYAFFGVPPFMKFPERWIRDGLIQKAGSIHEIAAKINVPADNLAKTVERYNGLARNGHDDDFNRGDTAWARYFGDGNAKHPNLGPVEKAPFYAVAIWPGDLGTKGGIDVNEDAQAIRADGTEIEGLFACGNTNASVMGDTYPGAGGTIGPAMVSGYIAANKLAETKPRLTNRLSWMAPSLRPPVEANT